MAKIESIELLQSGRVGIFISGVSHGEIMFSPESAKVFAELLLQAVESADHLANDGEQV